MYLGAARIAYVSQFPIARVSRFPIAREKIALAGRPGAAPQNSATTPAQPPLYVANGHMQLPEETAQYGFRTCPRDEEIVNAAIHGVGFLLSLLGTAAIAVAWQGGNAGRVIVCGIYAATLIFVYAVSTLSHAVQRPRAKHVLRSWDQGAIYLLIIGTYTPLAWAFLPPRYIGPFLGAAWAAALLGFYSKVVVRHRVQDSFSAASYVALGWVPALSLVNFIPLRCLVWMAIGGVTYTAGTWLLKMAQRGRYFHAAWHVCVIIGSACHYYAVFSFVVLHNAPSPG